VTVIDESSTAPIGVTTATPDDSYRAIGERVAALIPAGARLQVGPGPLGSAVLQALSVPVHIDSGMLIDGVATLDARGLLLGTPIATYLSGTESLYGWADGRPVLHPVEATHDLGRASAPGLFCVNTALEVDLAGNVNVEGTRRSLLGGIGGHADYAVAASRSIGGLSVIGLPVLHDGSPTLVRALSQPVTTPGHDVDVVVTERGCADLRGRDRAERRALLEALWGGLLREEGTA
jgi:acyl-CoA hydrolase